MDPTQVRSILNRIAALEAENLRLQRQAIGSRPVRLILLISAIAIAFTLGRLGQSGSLVAGPQELALPEFIPHEHAVVEAEQFLIRDKRGTIRFSISLTPEDDNPVLEFLDEREEVRMTLGTSPAGMSGMTIFGKDGEKRSGYGILGHGGVGLSFLDGDGEYRMGLGVREDQSASLEFRDAEGETLGSLGVTGDGEAYLDMPTPPHR